jgi:adenylate cyclase
VHVRDIASAHALPPIRMKGIAREVVPYMVEGLLDEFGATRRIFQEHATGVDLYLDLSTLGEAESERVRSMLTEAIEALERRKGAAGVETS